MSMVRPIAPLLPPEDLADQISTIEVLLSIYNGSTNILDNERGEEEDAILTLDNYNAIRNLAEFLSLPIESMGQGKSVTLRDALPAAIQLGLKLEPLRGTLDEKDDDEEVEGARKKSDDNAATRSLKASSKAKSLVLNVNFVLRRLHSDTQKGKSEHKLEPRWNLLHADWLSRSAYEAVCRTAKEVKWEGEDGAGYIMNVIEAISEASLDHIQASLNGHVISDTIATTTTQASSSSNRVLRTWHLLVSLSMKDKRRDLVSCAHRYDLSGFVLAGKPGLVVLECPITRTTADATKLIDTYWSDIKTTSWSDLPPASKKVTEKLREEDVERCFNDIREITGISELGGIEVEEGGRVARNDLDKVRAWLRDHGCIDQLDIVLGKEAQ
ncbi:hypothetical protein CBS101457_003760 [Exobasidium rhododendri]|nr:hypothetical protein CBS101457_003760 [Exobasidium rhododendri]